VKLNTVDGCSGGLFVPQRLYRIQAPGTPRRETAEHDADGSRESRRHQVDGQVECLRHAHPSGRAVGRAGRNNNADNTVGLLSEIYK
jgi:hypothetical protein